MAERYQLPDGRIAEKTPEGKYRIVSGSPAIGPAIGNDPRIPGALTGQGLNNRSAAVGAEVDERTKAAQIRKANADASKAEADARTARIEGGNPGFDREKDLRSAFEGDPAVKAYKDAATSLGIMLKTPDKGGGDIQIIYNFIKAQGPGPVAQGELELAQSVASFKESLEQQYGKLTSSNRLPPRVRRELVESARQAVAVKRAQFDQVYAQYRSEASRNGLNPEAVTGRHPADAVRPMEEKYIRQHGQTPHSAVSGRPVEVAAPDSKFTTQHNPERSSFIDALVRNQVPFERAQEAYRQQFPGAPVFDSEAKWNEALGFARRHPNAAGSFGQSLDQVPLSQTDQDRNFLGQTAPGQAATLYFNAAAGGIPSALAGQEGQQTVEASREGLGGLSLIPEGLGAITGTLGATKALGMGSSALKNAPIIGRPFNFLANNPTARMMTADIGYGGLYGATQNPDNPLSGAVLGAGAGAAGNVIGNKVIAPGIRAGGAMLGHNPAPALPRANDMIAGQAMKANPDEVMGRMQEAVDLRMPFTLADADPRLRALGGSVVRKSPDAYALAQSNIGSRTAGQADRVTTLIGNELAPPGAIGEIVDSSIKRARAGSKDLYDTAIAAPAPEDAALNDTLRSPTMEGVARRAYEVAVNKGENPASLSFEVDSITGQTRIAANPNWRTLQYMKFELDKMPEGGGVGSLRRRFNAQLSRLNPDFRKANKAYGDIARQGSAAQAGYNAAAPGVSPANLGLPKDNMDFFRQGYASRMADQAGQMRLSGNPYEAVYGSPWQQQKLGQVFPQGAPNFAKARGIESEMTATNRELFGGSPTQPRAEADKLFEGGAFGDILQAGAEVASGTPPISAARSALFAGRAGFGGLRDTLRLGMGRSAQQRADELAPLLFNPNSEEVLSQLGDILAAKRARDAYVQRTGLFGSAIGAPLAIGYTASR